MLAKHFEGIIIKTHASRESDLVLRVLSPELGKVAIYAKYARSSKRRFTGGLEIFDRGSFKTTLGRSSLLNLDSFSPVPPFKALREDLIKLTLASVISESFDMVVKEDQDQPEASRELYETIILGLSALDEAKEARDACRASYLTLVGLLCKTGFIDTTTLGNASLKNFSKLLDQIEYFTERALLSRTALEGIFVELRREVLSDNHT